jgi:aerobic carbon-monoxide dehydrogenase medium subunit
VIPAQFEYARPTSVDEALGILRDNEGGAKILSGGYSLLPLLKLRLAQPELLVDIRDLPGLDRIVEADDDLRIGGRATHAQIAGNGLVRDRYPILHDAAGGIGDPQIRNWGTIGGSCAHADPSSDWPAVLLATRATLVLQSADGERTIAARDFFLDSFQTAIEATELLTEVRFPRPEGATGGAYAKLERRIGDFATVGVAAQLTLGEDGRIGSAGIALTAVAETPFAATDAEQALVGEGPTDDAFRAAGAAAADQSRPAADGHGPVAYKRAMAAEITVRALRRAADRAQAAR